MDDLRYQLDMLKAMNKTYAANEKIYKLICQASNRVFVYYNPQTGLLRSYGKWNEYFDFVLNDYSDLMRILDIFCEEDKEKVRDLYFLDREGLESDYTVAKLADSETYVKCTANAVYDENGTLLEKIYSLYDITKRHKVEENLTYMAYYDLMTNLNNRNSFIEKLAEFINRAEIEKTIVSVMMINIDDFHKINDTLGIVYGDEILQQVGLFLNDLTCESVIGARFEGDIYSLAIYDPAGATDVDTIYNKLKERLQSPFVLTNGAEVYLTVSVGVAEYPEAASKALELCTCGEIVMMRVKESGKNGICFFDSVILNEFNQSIKIENKLKEAVHNLDFFLNFQPQYESRTRSLRGVEALIRWMDEDGNLIPPSQFIPLAEKIGYILQIGDFVLEESIKTYMDWKRRYDIDLIMSVNISPIQYKQADFVSKVVSLVNKYEMKPSSLELEITESVLIDNADIVFEKMEELRDFGIRISIDDFGTGYSSLSYLRNLPADILKIDKSFIDTCTGDNSSKIIVSSIAEMAKKLGYETVAEGVETESQLNYLKEIGCDLIQGFYLGKPQTKEAMDEILLRLL